MKKPLVLRIESIIFLFLTVYLSSCQDQPSSINSSEKPFYEKPEHEKSQILYPIIQSYIEENKDDAIINYYFIKDIEKMLGNDIFTGNIYIEPQGLSAKNKETLLLYANNNELSTNKYLKPDKEKGLIKKYELIFTIDSLGQNVMSHYGIVTNTNGRFDTIFPKQVYNLEDSRADRSKIKKISAQYFKQEKIRKENERKHTEKSLREQKKKEEEREKQRETVEAQQRVQRKIQQYGVEEVISAKNLYVVYKYNGVAAKKIYSGKKICVTGIISEIGVDEFSDNPYLRFDIDDFFGGVICQFSISNENSLVSLSPGHPITIVGICDRFSAEYVVIRNCQVF